ncbi:MAG TPA: hypothetical protein VF641_06755, partial [Methylobacterium sp.]
GPIRHLTDAGASAPEQDARKAFPTPGGWLLRLVAQTAVVALLAAGLILAPSLVSCHQRMGTAVFVAGGFGTCASRSIGERMAYLDNAIRMRVLASGR